MINVPKFDLEAIQRKVDANPIVPPVVVREAKRKVEAEGCEIDLSVAEKTLAELKELFND